MSVSERVMLIENRKRHEAACREIRKHLPSFLIVGEQLLVIREAGIYLETHKTLEAFIEEEFGIERKLAYRYMNAAQVKANLASNKQQELPMLPSNESQFREVAKAPPEQQAEVVRKAVEKAATENRNPTAKDYKQAVKQVAGELLDAEDAPKPDPPPTKAKAAEPEGEHHPKEMAGPLMAHCKTITQMVNNLKKRREEHGGQWLDVQAISSLASQFKYLIKSSIYYAECPSCGGKGCDRCRQSGFIPEYKSDLVEDKQKQ